MIKESEVQSRIRSILDRLGFKTYRNNTGAWKHSSGRWISYGLCEGSSDIIAFKKIKIKESMVGKNLALFCAIETKRPKKSTTTSKQKEFIKDVEKAGGFACIVSSESELEKYLIENDFV